MASHPLLSQLQSADPLRTMSVEQLDQMALEIRDLLCNLLAMYMARRPWLFLRQEIDKHS
jgi:deoxyxylulose-5-phosphate synthase